MKKIHKIIIIIAVIAVVILAACVIAVLAVPKKKAPSGLGLVTDKEEISVFVNGKETLLAGVTDKGRVVKDAEVSWTSRDGSVAVVDGSGTVTGKKAGTTEIVASVKYNGAKKETAVAVTVENDIHITLPEEGLELYLSEPAPEYKKTAVIMPHVTENGSDVDNPAIIWTSAAPELVSIENGVITARGATGEGETVTLTAEYLSPTGEKVSADLSVSVYLPGVESAYKGCVELFGDEEETVKLDMTDADMDFDSILSVTDVLEDADIPFEKEGKSLIIKKEDLYSGIRTWEFNAGDVIYGATVKVVTKFIRTADDINHMKDYCLKDKATVYVDTIAHEYEEFGMVDRYTFRGYFELMNDIDYGGNIIPEWCGKMSYGNNVDGGENWDTFGFHGTFEGNGHSISNYVVDQYFDGLFGTLGTGGIVRNLALLNVELTHCTAGAVSSITGGRIENVIVTGKRTGEVGYKWWTKSGMLCGRCQKTANIRNVFVFMDKDGSIDDPNFNGLVFGTLDPLAKCENVVGVGPILRSSAVFEEWAGLVHDGSGIRTFKTLEEMKKAVSFDGWDAIWDGSGEMPALVPKNRIS